MFLNKYIVLDIETTGLQPSSDSILEISAIKVIDGIVIDVFDHLVKYEFPISAFITNLTGITSQMVYEDGRNIYDVLLNLYSFVEDIPIVGHCINFDIGFINKNYKKHVPGLGLSNVLVDTCSLARKHYKGCINHKLETLAKLYNKKHFPSHRALNDVLATYELYEGMKNKDNHE
jgi:DNA polymerase-3 subunit epsilon